MGLFYLSPVYSAYNQSMSAMSSDYNTLSAYPIRAILFAILILGSAQNPHVLRVRSGFCALSVSKLAAPITPGGIGS
ncbi:hypothetical protein D3D45_08485 [Salmonella enterica]|nr:hypothetical protein [Salmonella enterica]ECF7363715.1 hypothetical protein [Salmonella enterica subsp. enterica]ECS6212770.1 hypothetical protein [Salmonella enterica subsp. enterica serovar Lomalinda]EBL2382368.1 hypothetical protein [Salmonella enterica]EBM5770527.1 hypothetical protein [Salmonella enterica]